MVDTVRHVGGWLYDQVLAGWEVTVLTREHQDIRPLEILGARVVDLDSALSTENGLIPEALVASAELYSADERIRAGLNRLLEQGSTKFSMWGDGIPADLAARFSSSEYCMSRAAQVFKRHALVAAAVPAPVIAPTESFRTSGFTAQQSGHLTSV
ncbi:hypothetical protein ACFWB0_00560 [Rhodococcus sp. NPDC060086]|uniref:hypothetical protein n=1 Tax=Rhodococcus sp. NPDC060086 TaxID=3347055 RepID=UPI003655E321